MLLKTTPTIKYKPKYIFVTDFDFHSDHRMVSIAFDYAIKNVIDKQILIITTIGFIDIFNITFLISAKLNIEIYCKNLVASDNEDNILNT